MPRGLGPHAPDNLPLLPDCRWSAIRVAASMIDPTPSRPGPVRFGPFELDLHAGLLRRAGLRVEVAPRPFALLCHLARHAGRVVSKDELLDAVWGRQFLAESAIKATVNNLRRTLGEDGKAPRWIVSAPRRGYCLQLDEHRPSPGSGEVIAPGSGDPGLIGREAELQQIVRLLGRGRLLTVLGPSGIGKTRLAVAALPALQALCAEGAALVRLQDLRSDVDLVAGIAQACGLPEQASRNPAALALGLARRQQGLLLDNGEHVLDALAPLLVRLLAQAPGLRVLVTSQVALGLPGEQRLLLRPLALPPADGSGLEEHAASALMLQRLRDAPAGAAVEPAQAALLADVCRALDGVPLQIELAAARVRVLGLERVHAHLDDRLLLLRQEARGVDARHRSLRASIEWSHDLLDARQQRVLHQLSVFESAFGASRVQHLLALSDANPSWELHDVIEALSSRCLIAPAGDDPGVDAAAIPAEPRWQLLQSLRIFAAEQLEHAGRTAATRDAHLQVMLALLRQQMADAHDLPIRSWAARIKPDLADVRAALQHARRCGRAEAWSLWALAVLAWLRNGLPHEATGWWQTLEAELAPPDDVHIRADCALALALMCLYNLPVELPRGLAAADEAVRLNARLGRTVLQYHALYVQGQLLLRDRQALHEKGTLAAMQVLERPDWSPMRLRYRRLLQGLAVAQQGRADEFRLCAEAELQWALALGNRDYIWTCRHSLAQAVFACGDVSAATVQFENTWQEIEAAGQVHLYWSTQALTAVLLAARDAGSARSGIVSRALRRLWLNQQLHLVAAALPWLASWQGRWSDAARLLGWSRALLRRRGECAGPIPAWADLTLSRALAVDHPAAALDALALDGEVLDEAQALALADAARCSRGPLGRGGSLTP